MRLSLRPSSPQHITKIYELFAIVLALCLSVSIVLLPYTTIILLTCCGVILLCCALSPVATFSALLVVAPLRTLIATEAALQLPLDIGQIMFLALLAAYLLHLALNPSISIQLPKKHIIWGVLFIYLAVTGMTAFVAYSFSFWLSEWVKWLVVVTMAIVTYDFCNRFGWRYVVYALLAAGAAQAVIGLYTFLGGSGADHLYIGGRFFRAFGTFGQPNPFGAFMGLLAPIAIMSSYTTMNKLWRLRHRLKSNAPLLLQLFVLLGIAGLLVVGLFASWSRGAWLGFIASGIIILAALPKRTATSLSVLLFVCVSGWIIWNSGFLPSSVANRISSASQEIFVLSDIRGVDITPENYPILERLGHWQAAIRMAEVTPWLGVGFGNFDAAYGQVALLNWDQALGHAHNYYLNVLAETGIIGLAAYLGLFIVLMTVSWRARKHPDIEARGIVIGLLGTWTYLLMHSLTDNLYVNNAFMHVGVMIGLLVYIDSRLQLKSRKQLS